MKAGILLASIVALFLATGTARAAAEAAGLPFKVLDERVETTSGHISIGTMHLAKGDHLLVTGVTPVSEFLADFTKPMVRPGAAESSPHL